MMHWRECSAMFKRWWCRHVVRHDWDKTHGYRELPYDGSICKRCGIVASVPSWDENAELPKYTDVYK